jgi:hypothetical protein
VPLAQIKYLYRLTAEEIKEFCMKKNKLFGMVTLIVGVMLAFSFIGCGGDDDPNPNPNPGDPDTGTTWPGDAVLTKYNVKGLPQPAGISNIDWEANDYGNLGADLYIRFTGTYDAIKAVSQYFENKTEWVLDPDISDVPQYAFRKEFTNGSWHAGVVWANTSGYNCVVEITKI